VLGWLNGYSQLPPDQRRRMKILIEEAQIYSLKTVLWI